MFEKRWLGKTLSNKLARKGFKSDWLRKALVEEGCEQRLGEEGVERDWSRETLLEESFEHRLCEEGFRKQIVERSAG